MNKEEAKKKLNEEEYRVIVERGTEKPFFGKYLEEKSKGTYHCRLCQNPLFGSESKFNSYSGWPSFDQPIDGAVKYIDDFSHGTSRTEVVCSKCGGHLGHVFLDGPGDTTGRRYCINSVCLDLKKDNRDRSK